MTLKKVENHTAGVHSKPVDHVLLADRPALIVRNILHP